VVPGNDAAAPNVDPARDYLSVYIAITCEAFGIKQGPGCLSKFLSTMLRPGPVPTTQAQADRSTSSARGSRRTRAEGIAGAQSPPKAGTGGSRTPPARPNPASSLGQLLAGAAAPLTGTVNSLVGGHPGAASSGNPLPPLLHYLLGR
jgi:hypothetical protein